MKSKIYWSFIHFLKHIVEFLLLIIFIYIIFYIFNYSFSSVEPFSLPGVKIEIEPPAKMKVAYRPYLRNMRIYSEQIYENNKSDISNLFRKFGIM